MTSFTIVVDAMHAELQKKRRTHAKLLKQHAHIKVTRVAAWHVYRHTAHSPHVLTLTSHVFISAVLMPT